MCHYLSVEALAEEEQEEQDEEKEEGRRKRGRERTGPFTYYRPVKSIRSG
jgi:hypothetical protein